MAGIGGAVLRLLLPAGFVSLVAALVVAIFSAAGNPSAADTPTPSPSPTPSPPAFVSTVATFVNDTGQLASGLSVTLSVSASNFSPVSQNPPGCPSPSYSYDMPFPSLFYYIVSVSWATPCVDPGESATLVFFSDCINCLPAPQVSGHSWTGLTPAGIASTQTFCITGDSTGVGWQWGVTFTQSGQTTYSGAVPNGTVPTGSPASDISSAWVASIVGANEAGLSAAQLPASPHCFKVSLSPAAGAAGAFTFSVGSCVVTGNPSGCSFNPTIVQVPPVGGVTELRVSAGGAANESGGSSGDGAFPYAVAGGALAALLAVVAAGGGYARRHRA